MRVADTWMDGMRKYFYASTRIYDFKLVEFTPKEKTAVIDRKNHLRKRLKCTNFEWYMYNIIPELPVPPMDALFYGEIFNHKTKACFQVLEDYYIGMDYLCFEHKIIPKNYFYIDRNLGLLHWRDKCVTFSDPEPALYLRECPTTQGDAKTFGFWEMKAIGITWGTLRAKKVSKDGVTTFWCAMQVTNVLKAHKNEQMPQISTCDENDPYQIWIFSHKFDYSKMPEDISIDHHVKKPT